MRDADAPGDAALHALCARHLQHLEHVPLHARVDLRATPTPDVPLRVSYRRTGAGWALEVIEAAASVGADQVHIMDARAKDEGVVGCLRGEWPWREAAAGLLSSALVRGRFVDSTTPPSPAQLLALRWPEASRAAIEQLAIVWRQHDAGDLEAIDRIVCALYTMTPDERFTLQRWRWQLRTG